MTKLSIRIKRAIGVVGIGLVASVAVAPGAMAGQAGCASGYACFWEDSNYKTDGSAYNEVRFFLKYTDFSYLYYYGSKNAHDNVSSLYNNGNSETITVYKDTNLGGQAFSVSVQSYDGDLSNAYGYQGFNDEIDSGCFSSQCL